MLNQLRSLTKTWVATILVALLVASFAVWGVSDIFTAQLRDAVAVVGKEPISVNRFAVEFDRELNRVSEQSGTALNRSLAVQFGIDRQVLERMSIRSAMSQKSRDLGLVASEAAIARELRAVPSFIDPITDRFDRDSYLLFLGQNAMTPTQFESELSLDVTQRQLGAALGGGIRPPNLLGAARLRFARELRSFSVVTVPVEAAGDIAEPTPEELDAFYAEREAAYAVPSRRAITFVTLSIEDFIPDVPIDETLVQEMYEQQRDSLRTPERRDVVEIAAPDEATAQQAATRLRAGEEPAAVAQALGLAAPNTYDDALQTDLLTREIGAAAFAVASGEVTDPVDGRIAWFVAKVGDVTAGNEQTPEQARAAIVDEIARDAAGEMLFDAIDAFEAARNQGASLEEAAVAAGVPAFVYGPVDQTGASLNGARSIQFETYPEVLRTAFAQPVAGATGELEELGEDGYFALRVDEIVAAATRPLAEVEPQVRAQYALVKRSEALDALAETARARLAEGASASDAAAAASPTARGEISEVRRDQATPTLSRDILVRGFTLSARDVFVAGSPDGGRLVVRVDAITPPDELPPQEIDQLREFMTVELLQDLSQLYVQDLQRSYPIRIDQTLLAQATGVDIPR